MICAVHALCVGSHSNAWGQQERLEVRSSSLQAEAASLTGFGSPLQNLPFAITNIDTEALKSFGLQALSDVLRSDPAVSDAYNTLGYPENFAIRGFLIDPRLNYRRDGMPVNVHAPVAFDN